MHLWKIHRCLNMSQASSAKEQNLYACMYASMQTVYYCKHNGLNYIVCLPHNCFCSLTKSIKLIEFSYSRRRQERICVISRKMNIFRNVLLLLRYLVESVPDPDLYPQP